MKRRKMPPLHPGEILSEEFMAPKGISQYRLARDIHVSPRRVNEIVHGKRAVTADTALRLGLYFGVTPQFWLGLQSDYDLDMAKDAVEARLKREIQPCAAMGTQV